MSRFGHYARFIAASLLLTRRKPLEIQKKKKKKTTTPAKTGFPRITTRRFQFCGPPDSAGLNRGRDAGDIHMGAGFKSSSWWPRANDLAPVAMQFDADGRLWVVEMNGFMPTWMAKGEDVENGRVVVLEDTATTVEWIKRDVPRQLILPRAIMLRKGGALVAVPPRLWCPDANGDLKAMSRCFSSHYTAGGNRSICPRCSSLRHWIYNAKSNRRFRFMPGATENETPCLAVSGDCQDDFGRLFTTTTATTPGRSRAECLPFPQPDFKNAQG